MGDWMKDSEGTSRSLSRHAGVQPLVLLAARFELFRNFGIIPE